uniref:Uncharacterized protein n=1 Tax=Tetranychus urticae TaxID=32264 RepID=T1KNS8_TETUR
MQFGAKKNLRKWPEVTQFQVDKITNVETC